MPIAIVAHQEVQPGVSIVIEASAPNKRYQVVFEDDGTTGYIYAVDPEQASQPIQDAVQIYNVEKAAARKKPLLIEIVWSSDNLKAELRLNNEPNAVVDFGAKQAYCRSGFPAMPFGGWSKHGHAWDPKAVGLIK